jgi:NADPH-dependent 2,4-dienoyl-CoA reductase/sulfur reductase-like enzyme
MVAAGTPPKAIVEIMPAGRVRETLPHLPGALRGWRYLSKGLGMIWSLRRAGVRIYRRAHAFAIVGESLAEAVTFEADGREHRIEAEHVALHMGVIPNQQLSRMVRCEHIWDASQHCFRPKTDEYGETSESGVFVAGDAAGIGGAQTAIIRGQMVARRAASRAGHDLPDGALTELRRALAADIAVRPFLETLYAPAPEIVSPPNDVMVCRCEEVTAGAVRESLRQGAPGPNQVKAFLRCGMGPCQGRTCGPVVTDLTAEIHGISPGAAGYFRIRPPLKPLPLMELAAIAEE